MVPRFPLSNTFRQKRFIFQHGDGAGDTARGGSARRIETNLPTPESQEQVNLRLAALEGRLTEEESRRSLESLRIGVELQQEDQRQEGQEVTYLLSMAQREGALDNATQRETFMRSVQERMTLSLAVLVADEEITEAQLAPNAIAATLQQLEQNKGSLRVRSASGERNLYPHEQNLLRMPAILSNHANDEVKRGWEQISQSMRNNVRLMRAASNLVGGQSPDQSLTGRVSRAVRETFNTVVETWAGATTGEKALIAGAAALGVIGLVWGMKKLFGRNEGGSSGRRMLFGLLGAGAVIAGGVWLYNRLHTVDEAWERLRGGLRGLSQENFMRGLQAYRSGDRETARRHWGPHADELMRELGGEGSGIRQNIDTPENREQARYMTTRDTLIHFYCLNEREYPEADRVEIRQAFNHLRTQPVSRVFQLWEANKNNSPHAIPQQNGTIEFPNSIQPKNIYTAVRIIGRTYEVYSRRFNIDENQNITVDAFLDRVSSDPIHEASDSIHNSLMQMVSSGAMQWEQLNMNDLLSFFERQQQAHTDSVCEKLGVNIQQLTPSEKGDFYAIAFSLYRDARLSQSADEALQNIGTQNRSANAIAAARELFEKTKQRTLQTVLPGVISRFNIVNTSEAGNANILRDYLTVERLTFGQAFHLNVISANFSFEASEIVSDLEELTLLFVALKCLPEEQRLRYYSEMGHLLLNADSNITLPSFERLRPYFSKLKDLALEHLNRRRQQATDLLSAFFGDRTDAQDGVFRERVRNADGVEFAAIGLQEGVRGGIMVAGDLYHTLVTEMGATYEDCQADGAGTIELVLRLGGALILPGERDGRGTGMLYLGGKYFFIKPFEIGWNTILAGWNGQDGDTSLWGRTSAAAKTYVVGAAPYVVVGAALGMGRGWQGIAVGAARGLAAPVSIPIRGIQAGLSAFEMGRQAFTRGSLSNLLRNADMVDAYRQRIPRGLSGSEWVSREGLSQARHRVFFNDWNASRYDTSLDNFRRSYNALFGFTGEEGLVTRAGERENFIRSVRDAQERVRNFTNALANNADLARASNIDEMKAVISQVGEGALNPDEITKLLSKVDNIGFENMKRLFQDGIGAIGRESAYARGRALFASAVERIRTWRSGAEVAGEAGETTGRSRRALDFTLDVLRSGREIGKEVLSSIWMALRSDRATARYQSVWNTLMSLPGATAERVTQFAEACRNSQRLGQLREAVGRLNLFRLNAAVTAADAAEEIAKIARLSNADISTIFRSLRAGEVVDAIRMAQLDETLRTTEGIQEARRVLSEIGVVGDNADEVIRSVTTATSEAEFLQRLRQSGLITEAADVVRPAGAAVETAESAARSLRHLDSAIEAIRNGERVGFRQLNALRSAANSADFADRLRAAGVASDKIDEVVRLLRGEAELARLKTGLEATGVLRLSRGVSGMINVARIGGPLLAGAGVVAGGAEAWQSFAMAREVQNNDELREIYYARGGVNIAAMLGNLAIDVGAIAGSRIAAATAGRAVLGVAGRGLAYVGGAAALPLTIIFETSRYMISGALEAQAEIARTNEDWLREASQKGYEAAGVTIRRDSNGEMIPPSAVEQQRINDEIRNVLIHDWYTTGEDVNAGEAYSSFFTPHTIENYRDQRVNTRLKLVEAIIKLETGNRSNTYNGYRVRYIESKTSRFNVQDFMKAEKVLEESRIFADIMENRDQVLNRTYEDGTQATLNLRDAKYDLENIQIADVIAVSSAAEQQNNNEIKQLIGDALFDRITNPDTGLDKNYLNYAISVMMAYICEVQSEHPEQELSEADTKIQRTAEALRKYLEFEGYRFTPNMSLSDPRAHMEDVNKVIFDETISAEEITERMGFTPRSKGVAGLYVYASALGYKGSPNIGGLQSFFTEAKKDRFGIYWRPDTSIVGNGEWVVNEEGMESDNEAGSNPDVAVLEMIRIIREEPGNILTSRFDYITDLTDRDDEKKRVDMILKLADMMERAYNNAAAPANTQEYQGSTSVVSNLLSTDTWRESLGETADTITTGVTTIVTSTRDAIGSVLSSAGSGIGSIASGIGSIFSSNKRE